MANQANVNVIKHLQVYQEGSESYEGQQCSHIPKMTSKLVDGGGLYLSCVVVYFWIKKMELRFHGLSGPSPLVKI